MIPVYSDTYDSSVYVSHSVFFTLTEITMQVDKIKQEMKNVYNINYIFSLTNPYEFIYKQIDDINNIVSKLNSTSLLIYNLIEINIMVNMNSNFYGRDINILFNTSESEPFKQYMKHIRQSHNDIIDEILSGDIFNTQLDDNPTLYDFMYFDISSVMYEKNQSSLRHLLAYLPRILIMQKKGGIVILKMNNLYHKPILDILYILSGMYSKTYICKPHISSIEDRFIVCEGYINNMSSDDMVSMLSIINSIMNENNYICSLLNESLPKMFINKIEESNVIVAYQSIERYDELINICKSKNICERLENYKKMSISKCIQWCKNHNIPHATYT